ncbi:hypothetical protein [Streptomyces sp. NPDC058751]|uniref:hypothetical protein n=1 Tax=Streptomyces sp. NPDC058751 TaxID=3346623 RepID=UPI0036CAFCD0
MPVIEGPTPVRSRGPARTDIDIDTGDGLGRPSTVTVSVRGGSPGPLVDVTGAARIGRVLPRSRGTGTGAPAAG